jgi:hypothetical protein
VEYYILVFLHVATGIFWGGSLLFTGFFLIPSILEAGPGGGAVMAGVMKRGYSKAMSIAAIVSILSGLRLYYLRFQGGGIATPEGIVLTLGGLLGLGAWALGLFKQRPLAEKMAALVKEGRGAEVPPVAAQFAKIAKVTAWHVVAVVVLMAGHRLAALL